MLSLKVHTRPIFGQAFPSLIEEMQICCSATEQNNLEIAGLITKRHDLEANTTNCYSHVTSPVSSSLSFSGLPAVRGAQSQ